MGFSESFNCWRGLITELLLFKMARHSKTIRSAIAGALILLSYASGVALAEIDYCQQNYGSTCAQCVVLDASTGATQCNVTSYGYTQPGAFDSNGVFVSQTPQGTPVRASDEKSRLNGVTYILS